MNSINMMNKGSCRCAAEVHSLDPARAGEWLKAAAAKWAGAG